MLSTLFFVYFNIYINSSQSSYFAYDIKEKTVNKSSIFVSVAVLFGFLWSGIAAAEHEASIGTEAVPKDEQQQAPTGISKWPTFLDCGPTSVILQEFKGNRGEKEMLMGMGVIQIPGANAGDMPRPIQVPIIQYFNIKTTTFSLIAHLESGMSCVVLFGGNLQPMETEEMSPKPQITPEDLDEKLDKTQPVDPRDIKVDPQAEGGAIAWNI